MDIRGARFLVTGGCGLIGSTTIDMLLKDHSPEQIIIYDNLNRGSIDNVEHALQDKRVTWIRDDIRNVEAINKAMQGVDFAVHLAALRITACAADTRDANEVMCDGTFNVIDAAHKANVKKVMAASSASIYGLATEFPTKETHHPYGNRTLYGAAKIYLEGLLRSYNDMFGLNYVATRYFNVYGPRMDIHGKYTEVLIRWMERISAGQPPLILGDGSTSMDFVYIDDVARANIACLKADVSDEVFNVARGEETTLNDLAAALMRVMGAKNLKCEYGPERKVNAVPRRLADVSKAEKLLGFRAQVGLEEGLARLVDWWATQKKAA
jgi:UDP-glucose 4-epimerase